MEKICADLLTNSVIEEFKFYEVSEYKVWSHSFPGSNCDKDCQRAFEMFPEFDVKMIWHKETPFQKLTLLYFQEDSPMVTILDAER